MKFGLLGLFLLLTAVPSFGYKIESKVTVDGDGIYNQMITLQCNAKDSKFCSSICNDPLICSKQEPLCLDCGGTSSSLLRVIFTRLSSYFEVSPDKVSTESLIPFLTGNAFILVSSKSLYNYYRAWDDKDIQAQFASLCPAGSQLPLLGVTLDDQNRPTNLIYSFCQISETETYAYSIRLKNNRSPSTELH